VHGAEGREDSYMGYRTIEEWRQICHAGVKRHPYPTAGPKTIPDVGLKCVERLHRQFIAPGSKVFDIGCGHATLPIGLDLYGISVDYLGVDIVPQTIQFCQSAFDGLDAFRFEWWDVKNTRYHKRGAAAAETIPFNLDSNSFDYIVASSLFTHLGTAAAADNYLRESSRCLRANGVIYSSWFTSPPNKRDNGADRTVYELKWIRQLFNQLGLQIEKESGGQTSNWHDQRVIIARKK